LRPILLDFLGLGAQIGLPINLKTKHSIPRRLAPGDTIGLIAPSSAPIDPKAVDRSVAYLERRGFRVKVGKNARARRGFLAGHDRGRAADLMEMFQDRKVDGIICIRGGYGAARVLPLLDYDVIRKHTKVLIGFSDITNFHCALLKHANLQSFQGPMTAHQLLKKDYPDFSVDNLWRIVTEPQPAGGICRGYPLKTVSILRGGKANGELIGGNLTVLTHLLGTPYQPDFHGKILLLEEVDELPYRIDRMLTHLHLAGVFNQVSGVAVGVCQNCEDPKAKQKKPLRQSLADVLRDRLGMLKVPVVTGLPFGHADYNATLPIGGRALLDGDAGDLVITGAAVG
jgi:muramoyltetrapeptide carboxypeptidase